MIEDVINRKKLLDKLMGIKQQEMKKQDVLAIVKEQEMDRHTVKLYRLLTTERSMAEVASLREKDEKTKCMFIGMQIMSERALRLMEAEDWEEQEDLMPERDLWEGKGWTAEELTGRMKKIIRYIEREHDRAELAYMDEENECIKWALIGRIVVCNNVMDILKGRDESEGIRSDPPVPGDAGGKQEEI